MTPPKRAPIAFQSGYEIENLARRRPSKQVGQKVVFMRPQEIDLVNLTPDTAGHRR